MSRQDKRYATAAARSVSFATLDAFGSVSTPEAAAGVAGRPLVFQGDQCVFVGMYLGWKRKRRGQGARSSFIPL